MSVPKIYIIGMGGVGGYFGGKLALSKNTETTFVCRGKHYNQIKEKGLEVQSINGNFKVIPHRVIHSISEAISPDIIVICTKSWQLTDIAKNILPILKPETIILPLQNGADNVKKLSTILPEQHILGGLCRIVSYITSPGAVSHVDYHPEIIIGETSKSGSNRTKHVQQLFEEVGVDCRISDDITLDIWKKFMYIVSVSGIGAVTEAPIGYLRNDLFLRQFILDTALEIVALAKAKGINLLEKDAEKMIQIIDQQKESTTASMQRDMMERNPSELDTFNGYVIREAQKYGLQTSNNATIYHLMKYRENKVRNNTIQSYE